jgi:inhibitor of cysteine peptidase
VSRHALTESDTGRTLAVMVGDEIAIVLDENPTTGFRWTDGTTDAAKLSLVHSSFRPRSAGLGAGGEREVTFEVTAAGRLEIHLKLCRPWETETPGQRQFDLVVDARDTGSP